MTPDMKTVGEFEAAVIAAETDHDGGKVTLPLALARRVLASLRKADGSPQARQEAILTPDREAIDRVAAAIESAEIGHNLRLTRLVDGEETYTLTYSDGTPPLTFSDIDDGYLHVRARKRKAQAVAVINALAPPEIDGGRFAEWSLNDIAAQCRMQSREQLDPEFSQFMAEVAGRFFSVLAEPAASCAKPEWHDIAEAPKDGSSVLLAWRAVTVPGETPKWFQTVGWWDVSFEATGWDEAADRPTHRAAWTDGAVASWGYQETRELHPILWMPLPDAPSAEGY